MQCKTVSKAVIEFLKGFESLEVDTNHLKDGSDMYGLFKSPNRSVNNFINREYTITEYYQFLARQSSNSEYDRKDSDEWLEELTYWADDYQFKYLYPELTNGRCIENIEVTGIPYPMEAGEKEILYQMSLAVTYVREREDYQGIGEIKET